MSALVVPTRLARREVRRRPGRTALVALLVALPVAGMVLALTLVRSQQRSEAEQWRAENGSADAVARSALDERAGSWLPAGSVSVTVRSADCRVRTEDGRRSSLQFTDAPVDAALTTGIFDVVEGRAPIRPGEVALTPEVATALGVGTGDVLKLVRPPLTAEVVGLVEDVNTLSRPLAFLHPSAPLPVNVMEVQVRTLVDLPADVPPRALQRLEEQRVDVHYITSEVVDGYVPDDATPVVWSYVIGALVLMVVGIVIAAAFAAGARRQLTILGQLSANGADGKVLRRTLVLQGTFTGVVGAAVGLGLGSLVLVVARPLTERVLDRRIDGIASYDIRPAEVAVALVIGVAASTFAALVPARATVRIPTLQALAGRRPQPPVPRRLVVGGAVAVAVGLGLLGLAVLGSTGGRSGQVWALLAVGGGAIELLGACALAPALAAPLDPIAGRLRGSSRLAARSLARQRTRTGAIVAAVCAASALALAAAGLVRSNEAYTADLAAFNLPDDVVTISPVPGLSQPPPSGTTAPTSPSAPDPAVVDAISAVLPEATRVPLRLAAADGPTMIGFTDRSDDSRILYGTNAALVADAEALDVFRVAADAREVAQREGLVVLGREDAEVEVVLRDGRSIPARQLASDLGPTDLPVLINPGRAAELGLPISTGGVAFRSPLPLTEAERDELDDLQYARWSLRITFRQPSDAPPPLLLELLLSGVALVFSVLVVGASLALAAAESRDERDVLFVTGVPPRTLAVTAGYRAWLLATLGGLLALPIGLLPVLVYTVASEERLPFRVPWPAVAVLVATVPLVAAVAAWLASGVAVRLRPLRVSTTTFG